MTKQVTKKNAKKACNFANMSEKLKRRKSVEMRFQRTFEMPAENCRKEEENTYGREIFATHALQKHYSKALKNFKNYYISRQNDLFYSYILTTFLDPFFYLTSTIPYI